MIEALKSALKKRLSPQMRHVVGSAVGRAREHLLRPVQGFLFDVGGGVFKADGCRFDIPRNLTTMAYRSCFLIDDYEAEERELIRRFVRPEDSVLELGACIGIVSCVTNRLLADRSRHLVVEGNPLLIPAIHRNRQLNEAGFLVENCAVSVEKDVTFYINPEYIVGGTTQRKTTKPVRVAGRTLQELHDRHGPFNVMIMDIEGSEFDALRASPGLLTHYRLAIIELHPEMIGEKSVEECRILLRDAGLSHVGSAGITEAWLRP
jgi:FkbM family methyltransferase